MRAQLARAPGRAVLPRRDEHVRNRLRHLVGDVMRTMRTLDQRFHVVAGLAIATQPDVRRLTADPELATQLAEIHPALTGLPPVLPLEHELEALLDRIGAAPWHAAPTLHPDLRMSEHRTLSGMTQATMA